MIPIVLTKGCAKKFPRQKEKSIIGEIVAQHSQLPEISLNYGLILREFGRYPSLVKVVLEEKVIYRLFKISRYNNNFDLASDAFLSVRELLTKQKPVASKFVAANFQEFFSEYHYTLLADERSSSVRDSGGAAGAGSDDDSPAVVRLSEEQEGQDLYVVQRQGLKLLSDMLLDRSFMTVMLQYINSEEYERVFYSDNCGEGR